MDNLIRPRTPQPPEHFDPEVVAVFREIAVDLYTRAVEAGGAELRRELRAVLFRYFKT